MPPDKYAAVWLSYSSISDFLRCPRTYFLKNVYKDSKTGRKIMLMSPPLALGQAVHEVVESLSVLPVEQRFIQPLVEKFETTWKKVSGKKGGFWDDSTEQTYKNRGKEMLARVTQHPGPIAEKAVKLLNMDLPQFWLSEDDGIILCGKIDWLHYHEKDDSITIIDFKTSKSEEDPESLQLPIYHLLAHYCQKRPVEGVAYWYLGLSNEPVPKPLPDLQESQEKIMKIAKQVKTARALERFKCPAGDEGCRYCQPYEAILRGEAECVGIDTHGRRDVYILKKESGLLGGEDRDEGVIL